jgi:hypothetical protein
MTTLSELSWLRGWKSIATHLDMSPSHVKVLAKRHHMPIRHGPTGKPEIMLGALSSWYGNLVPKGPRLERLR